MIRAVTFDCWQTLLTDTDMSGAADRRVRALVELSEGALDEERARELLGRAWDSYLEQWKAGVQYGSVGMARYCADELGLAEVEDRICEAFEDAGLHGDVAALDGSHETLHGLREAGVRTALICDTGFTPGRVVRQLLARVGLLPHLEHLTFSNEVGVPKPHEKMFETTLGALGIEPSEAVHVGDLLRTDVAGARAVGMRTIRITATHADDPDVAASETDRAEEADAVVDSHAELRDVLRDFGVPLP